MFRSKVEFIYDYKNVNVSNELLNIELDEKDVKKSLEYISKQNAKKIEVDAVKNGDEVTIELKSDLAKYNKANIIVIAGMGLFNKAIEEKLINMKKNEIKKVFVDNYPVEIKILNIKRKVIPNVTDKMIAKLGIEKVKTVDEYKKHCYEEAARKEKENGFYKIYNPIIDEVVKKSKFNLVNEDIEELVDCQLDRCRAIAKEQNMDFDTMTREQLLAAIPCGSIPEFKEYLNETYKTNLGWTLIAMEYAKKENVVFNECTYNEYLKKVAAEEKKDIEKEKKVFPYLIYILSSYGMYMTKKIKKYYEPKYNYIYK